MEVGKEEGADRKGGGGGVVVGWWWGGVGWGGVGGGTGVSWFAELLAEGSGNMS